ncbi:MAG: NPCBM/NEW2 domain-containing protein [Deltaproteobacteria bacterium]
MAIWHAALLAAALNFPATGAPAAEIETLKGDRHAGELVSLDASAVVLKSGGNSVTVPLAEVLELRFPAVPPPEPATGPRIALHDGSKLTLAAFSVASDQARCEASFGSFTIPVARLAHVRFGISTTKLDEAWNALLKRESKDDLLVVRKEDVLDFLAGAAGDVGDKIGFLLDGDEVPVARDKAYGIIFHRRVPPLPRPVCEVRLAGGDVLAITRFAWDDGSLKVRLASGADLTVPAAQLAALDFSAGKVRYLSQLEPRDVKYVPFFEIVWEYRRDRSLDGTPLSVGGKSYARGLALHSKTTLRYRIAGEYSRFQAVAGIDDTVAPLTRTVTGADGKPDERYVSAYVRLVISGDGKPLFDSIVKGTDAPRSLDLDVSNVRDFEILVDFGNEVDIADHLDLAGARFLK